jgi:DNA-directed RNA polymerase specialized sigma24 family protein
VKQPSAGHEASLAALDDPTLLRAVGHGDEAALSQLYDRHAGWLTLRLSRRCGSSELVDQAVQDTFLALWRDARRYRGQGEVGAYIWGIGVRRLIDVLRRQGNGPTDRVWHAPPWGAQEELVRSADLCRCRH